MDGAKLIERIRLKNILSFGSEGQEIALEPLNVLIGPNGSGKSNFIEALSLLRAAPGDLLTPIRTGGGTAEWLWKGGPAHPVAEVDVAIRYPEGIQSLRYQLSFTATENRFGLVDESIENTESVDDFEVPFYFYHYDEGRPALSIRTSPDTSPGDVRNRVWQGLGSRELRSDQSILSQRKDPFHFPELTYLGNQFAKLQFYRESYLGRRTPLRQPQPTDLPNDFLLEDATNLGLILSNLERRGVKRRILEFMQRFYENVVDLTVSVEGGTLLVYFHERDLNQPISAARLSDGTLHFLCLLVILLHPTPPPLICIEEPEVGLHPDILPTVAELLTEASQRTQLIVTTHSETLVSALGEHPETVVVCERGIDGTRLERLDPDKLKTWLERYSLGTLWAKGEIGGNRW